MFKDRETFSSGNYEIEGMHAVMMNFRTAVMKFK